MAEDVHRRWVSESRARLDTLGPEGLEAMRKEALGARDRAQGAGDPREVVPVYQQLIDEIEALQVAARLEETLSGLDLEGLGELLAHPHRDVRMRTIRRAEELELEGAFQRIRAHLDEEPDPFVVATAVKCLGGLAGEGDWAAFRPWLTDADPRIRANALEGMAAAGAPCDELLRCAKDVDHRVRGNVALGVLDREPAEARRILRSLLEEPTESARTTGVGILNQIDPDRFLEPYLEALEILAPGERGPVMEALSRTPDPRVLRLVLDLLDDESQPLAARSQAMQAARSLAEVCEDEDWSEVLDAAARQFLHALATDDRAAPTLRAPAPEPRPKEDDEDRKPTGADIMREKVKRYVKVVGKVFDSADRRPIRGATVRVPSMGYQELTDRKGQFQLDRLLRHEVYVFVVEKPGYPIRSVRYRCSGKKEQLMRILLVGRRA